MRCLKCMRSSSESWETPQLTRVHFFGEYGANNYVLSVENGADSAVMNRNDIIGAQGDIPSSSELNRMNSNLDRQVTLVLTDPHSESPIRRSSEISFNQREFLSRSSSVYSMSGSVSPGEELSTAGGASARGTVLLLSVCLHDNADGSTSYATPEAESDQQSNPNEFQDSYHDYVSLETRRRSYNILHVSRDEPTDDVISMRLTRNVLSEELMTRSPPEYDRIVELTDGVYVKPQPPSYDAIFQTDKM